MRRITHGLHWTNTHDSTLRRSVALSTTLRLFVGIKFIPNKSANQVTKHNFKFLVTTLLKIWPNKRAKRSLRFRSSSLYLLQGKVSSLKQSLGRILAPLVYPHLGPYVWEENLPSFSCIPHVGMPKTNKVK